MESEDRQILSIQSQTTELEALGERCGGTVVRIFTEAQSAKAPGRPIFAQMMQLANAGEADAILCWKLDRLARNPIDGGAVIWAVNERGIKVITPSQTFQKGDESLILMWIELGMAHKFIIDLGKNVRRGMKTKADMGWKPALAPVGYKNLRLTSGLAVVAEDPDRFSAVRRMWDLLLTGQYSVDRILEMVNKEWGFRLMPTRRKPERMMSRCGLYGVFTNPFYHGSYEYPARSGSWHKGAHTPMVSKEEFDRAQAILGRIDRPRSQKHDFAFVGLMRCGDCNAMITAEEKWKHQKNGNVHHYIYYHCTRRKDPTCRQGSVEEKKLIEMMTEFLAELGVSSSFAGWAGQSIESFAAGQEEHEKEAKASIEKQLEKVARSLSELTRMRYQGLIDDQEFEREKSALLMEKNALADSLTGVTANSAQWKEGVSSVFNLMATVVERFANGDNATRRSIMSEIGSNLLLKDKIFICEAKIPYLLVQNAYRQILEVSKGLEPPENIAAKPRNPYFADVSRLLWTLVNDVRTYFMTNATEHMTTLPMDDCPEVSSIGGD